MISCINTAHQRQQKTYLDTGNEQEKEIRILGELLPQENRDKRQQIILASCDAVVEKLLSFILYWVIDMDATAGRPRVVIVTEEHSLLVCVV